MSPREIEDMVYERTGYHVIVTHGGDPGRAIVYARSGVSGTVSIGQMLNFAMPASVAWDLIDPAELYDRWLAHKRRADRAEELVRLWKRRFELALLATPSMAAVVAWLWFVWGVR